MNRKLTQLNATKKNSFKNLTSCAFYRLCWFSFVLLLSISTNAQTNNCPTGEPLEWEWLQEIISYSYGCDVAEIMQLDYEGEIFIVTIEGELENVSCISSTKNRMYDCLGTALGEFEGYISNWWNPLLFPGPYEYYSIWTYVEKTNQSIIPVEGCPGEVFEFEVGLPLGSGESCEPAGQRIGVSPAPLSYKPSIKNLTENDCTISFTFNENGDFIYSIYNPDNNFETFNYIFLLNKKENCEENTPTPQPVIPKDWDPFPANQKTWFEFSNENFKLPALYYASNVSQQDEQIRYYLDGNNTTGILGNNISDVCIENYTGRAQDFISVTEPFTEQNGMHYCKGQLVFDTNLMVGESLIIQSENYIDFDEVYMKCVEQRNEEVFGQSDEVKVFNMQAHANGQPVGSAFDNYTYVLSKSFGFLQFLPFTELLGEPKTIAIITGFEDAQSNLVGTKGRQFKPPYEAGDVIYYSEDKGDFPYEYSTFRKWRDSITKVIHYKDSLIYTFDRVEIIKEVKLTSIQLPVETMTIIDTIQSYNNKETYIYEEQLDNNNDVAYNPQGYGVYSSIYGYTLKNDGNSGVYSYYKLNITPGCFSFKNERATIVQSSKPFLLLLNDGCLFGPSLNSGSTHYHAELGKISIIYGDDCCVGLRWNLDAYKKGNQVYSPFLQLNPVYDSSDSPANLINECQNGTSYDITGSGIENGIFYPAFVPDSLFNQPIEINFKSGLYETKQTITVSNSNNEAFELDPFFKDKLWLSNHMNLRECKGETIQVFERGDFTYTYLTRNSGEGILFSSYYGSNPIISCEDTTEESTCLTGNNLSSPVATWSCSNVVSTIDCTDELTCDFSHSVFNIYPNPTSDKVFIDIPKNLMHQISLTNISGKVIKQVETQMDESIIEFDVRGLLKGIYLVELKGESNRIIQKLIIQ